MRTLALLLPLAAGLAAAAPASAAGPPFLSVAPRPAEVGDRVVIRGSQWPVIEFCSRRVRLSLVSAQNEYVIGFKRIRLDGRFRRGWTVAGVGPGRWRVQARLRCESGKDGSPNFIVRRKRLRILP